ncbi:hypothetical protein MKW92_000317 [Papaver armeniacum]|nr:hypothetical protein MKW92_000317 [Papaver armeniacum]
MVVNANHQSSDPFIYQIYLLKNPLIGKDGNPINVVMPKCLPTMDTLCQYFKNICKVMNQKINGVMHLVEVHEPYIFFKGK